MTTMNPYAAPRAQDPVPDVPRVFTARAVAAHTILLTPIAGVLMAASNWMRCGQRGRATQVALVYGFPTAALLFAQLATESRSLTGIAFVVSIVIAIALFRDQQELWETRGPDALTRRGWWVATLYCLAGIVILTGILLLAEELRGGQ
jgi:hypothetical protein